MKKMIKIMAMAVTVLLCVQCGKEKGDETVVDNWDLYIDLIYRNNCSTKINMKVYDSIGEDGNLIDPFIATEWDIPIGEEKPFGIYSITTIFPLRDSVIVSNGTQEIIYRNSYYNPETIYNPEEYHEHEITEDENGEKIWVCTYIFTDEMFEEEDY